MWRLVVQVNSDTTSFLCFPISDFQKEWELPSSTLVVSVFFLSIFALLSLKTLRLAERGWATVRAFTSSRRVGRTLSNLLCRHPEPLLESPSTFLDLSPLHSTDSHGRSNVILRQSLNCGISGASIARTLGALLKPREKIIVEPHRRDKASSLDEAGRRSGRVSKFEAQCRGNCHNRARSCRSMTEFSTKTHAVSSLAVILLSHVSRPVTLLYYTEVHSK